MAFEVGVVRDVRYLEHKPGLTHPESPNRLRSIYRMLDNEFEGRLVQIDAEPAALEHVELVHTPAYVKQIISTAERDFTTLAPDTSVSAKTYLAAWLAVGGCIQGLEAVLSGRCRVCFALVRPPGHHALRDRAGGFCIFNNLGITARYAQQRYGFKRILIIDWDIHHGNALQDLFYREKSVLYLSTHYMGWYPHTGDWNETGEGEGRGYNVNIPVPKEMEDNDIIHIYRTIINPVVRRYRPELVLVAAGFDAHQRDPLGRTRLSEKAYRWLAQIVLEQTESARGAPLLFALEGGYDARSLAASVSEVLGTLAFQGRRDRIPTVQTKRGKEVVEKVMRIHKEFGVWAT